MRTKTDVRIVVDADPEQVMAALAAVELLPEWSSSYSDVRVATRDQRDRPARVFVTADLPGGSDIQVLEYSWTPGRCSWEVADSTRGVRGRGWYEVTPGPDGTEVWQHVEQQLPFPLPGFLVHRQNKRAQEEVVERFAEFAERFPEVETAV
ncbi:SRPBCC family protein [Nocardia asteroides]|uniref:SRPBCC family protein n=1 Tax=Nocardia asteroides TaxID=1824 RepID=UPI001E46857A|nr:SRPBCC family protein [Nocardia asteroides]UGT59501.1 SRPBCC family protein [Nocardia asteroides]